MAASAGGSKRCVGLWGLDVAWAAVAVRKESSPIGDCDLRLVCAFAIVVAVLLMATALSTDKSTVCQQFEHF